MFECSRHHLSAALSAIVPATRGNSQIPILQNVCVERIGYDLLLRGNCLDYELTARIPATVNDDFVPFTCNADLFLKFVNAAPDASIRVDGSSDGKGINAVTLRSGRSRLRLLALPAADFPKMDTGDLPDGFTITGHLLSRPLQAVSYAVSTDKDRHFLHGVRLDGAREGLALIALDGKRMEYRRIAAGAFDDDVNLEALPKVTVPTASVKLLLSMIRKEEDVTVQLSETRARILIGNMVFITKLVEEDFVDYRRIIPADNHIRVAVDRARLDEAIGRVMLATSNPGKGVLFSVEMDRLTLKTYDYEVGNAEDEIDIEADEPIEIGFNGRFVRDILDHMDGDVAEIFLLEKSKPALIRPAGDDVNFSLVYAMHIPVFPT